jgi:hypothetical protein
MTLTLGQLLAAVWSLMPYVGVGGLWLLVAARLVARRARALTPQQKAELLRNRPRMAGLVDAMLALNVDGQWFGRALRTIAKGARAPGVVATLDMLDQDPDADGITLTQGLEPMRLLELPAATVYPPPTAELAARTQLSERYVLVHSLVPPSLGDDERSTK